MYLVKFRLQSHSSDPHTQKKMSYVILCYQIHVFVHENQVGGCNDFIWSERPNVQLVNVDHRRKGTFELRL